MRARTLIFVSVAALIVSGGGLDAARAPAQEVRGGEEARAAPPARGVVPVAAAAAAAGRRIAAFSRTTAQMGIRANLRI